MLISEERLVRDLPRKEKIDYDDFIVIEDVYGTKLTTIEALKDKILKDNVFVDNITDITTNPGGEDPIIPNIKEGDIKFSLGYRTVGDDGAGMYYIEYAPAVVADARYYHEIGGTDVLKAKFIPWNNTIAPEQFGAYGNGVNDDYVAINESLRSPYKVIFSPSKRYRISSIIIPESNKIYDFNGCTIVPTSCSFFGVPSSSSINKLENVTLRNVIIDMSQAGTNNAINFTKGIDGLTLENVLIYNMPVGKSCISIYEVDNLIINNCEFSFSGSPNIGQIGIEINGNNTKGGIESQSIKISKTKFKNMFTAINIRDTTIPTIASIDEVDHTITGSNNSATVFCNNGTTSFNAKKLINLNNIQTNGVKVCLNNIGNDNITLQNILMNNGNNLVTSVASSGQISIDGNISMVGTASPDKFPVYGPLQGKVYINTHSLFFDESRYKERNANSDTYGCMIFDSCDMFNFPITEMNVSGNVIQIPYMRNGIIMVTNGGVEINNLAGGIANQVIGLTSNQTAVRYIKNSSTFVLKGPDPLPLINDGIVYFKYTSGRWIEFMKEGYLLWQ